VRAAKNPATPMRPLWRGFRFCGLLPLRDPSALKFNLMLPKRVRRGESGCAQVSITGRSGQPEAAMATAQSTD
ncbi:MAG: hypothetical protein WCA56_04555, partial [Xanthobacteraceae bacterium]